MRFSELENSRVAILGMGREGLAVWRQIRNRYPRKQLSLFSESVIEKGIERLFDATHDQCHFGPLNIKTLKQYDVLVRSAGISPYREELKQLRSRGFKFTSASNLWFAENPDANTICISGTLGKSTTAALTAHLLNGAGFKTCLAGNIGRPMLDCESGDIDWWVIELSSYQICDLVARPEIAVLLNLSEEHLDWHRGLENYQADKLKLASMASKGRVIANYVDDVLVTALKNLPNVTWFNRAGQWQAGKASVRRQAGVPGHAAAPVGLPGAHNMQNLAAALTVVDVLHARISNLEEVLASYPGLPHRLQTIGEKKGIRYIDDSISTTPVSVSAALQTVGFKNVVLVLGGYDRGLEWEGFAKTLRDRTPYAIITIPDNGRKIFDCLKTAGIEPEGGLCMAASLKEAVALAQTTAPERSCILLSPGAPSFPQFENFEDRGNRFRVYSGF
jgi:UDP-N-acetylmuramoylalanine--D-glutamate ligase